MVNLFVFKPLVLCKTVIKLKVYSVNHTFLIDQEFEQQILNVHQINFVIQLINIETYFFKVFSFSLVEQQKRLSILIFRWLVLLDHTSTDWLINTMELSDAVMHRKDSTWL